MKIFLSVILLSGFHLSVNAQTNANSDLARVRKVEGVEAYIFCEPLRPYQVVVDAGTGIKAESLITAGLVNKTISGRVDQFVRNVLKQNPKIDAGDLFYRETYRRHCFHRQGRSLYYWHWQSF